MTDDNITWVEVTLPDGTIARWARVLDDDEQDRVLAAIESVLFTPDTLIT